MPVSFRDTSGVSVLFPIFYYILFSFCKDLLVWVFWLRFLWWCCCTCLYICKDFYWLFWVLVNVCEGYGWRHTSKLKKLIHSLHPTSFSDWLRIIIPTYLARRNHPPHPSETSCEIPPTIQVCLQIMENPNFRSPICKDSPSRLAWWINHDSPTTGSIRHNWTVWNHILPRQYIVRKPINPCWTW
jgi:hypothetical protein